MPNEIHPVYDLVVPFNNEYKYFLKDLSDSRGKCFGASLYWSTEFLKEIAGDENAIGFKVGNSMKFFDYSACVQNNYYRLIDLVGAKNSFKTIVDTLNKQEEYLSKTSSYSFVYDLINPGLMKKNLNVMLSGSPLYKNKCIVIVTRLDSPVVREHNHGGSTYAHATVVVNYNGKLFLFNVNRGVYKVPTGSTSQTILTLIAKNFGIMDNGINYDLSRFYGGIMIGLKKSNVINNNISTDTRYFR